VLSGLLAQPYRIQWSGLNDFNSSRIAGPAAPTHLTFRTSRMAAWCAAWLVARNRA
jgi:hypothetical protein